MSGTAARTPPLTPGRPATSDQNGPTVVETAEELIFFVDAIVVGATIMPGFLLCVPALAFIIVPVVAIGLVAAAAGLVIFVVALPVRVGWRVARRLRHGLVARRVPGTDGAPSELTPKPSATA